MKNKLLHLRGRLLALHSLEKTGNHGQEGCNGHSSADQYYMVVGQGLIDAVATSIKSIHDSDGQRRLGESRRERRGERAFLAEEEPHRTRIIRMLEHAEGMSYERNTGHAQFGVHASFAVQM